MVKEFKLICKGCNKEITISDVTWVKDIEKLWGEEVYVSIANRLVIKHECESSK